MLFFEPLLVKCVRRHVCNLVACVTCELRWVFDMLELSQREPKQVSVLATPTARTIRCFTQLVAHALAIPLVFSVARAKPPTSTACFSSCLRQRRWASSTRLVPSPVEGCTCVAPGRGRQVAVVTRATAACMLTRPSLAARRHVQRFVRFIMERVSSELSKASPLGPAAYPATPDATDSAGRSTTDTGSAGSGGKGRGKGRKGGKGGKGGRGNKQQASQRTPPKRKVLGSPASLYSYVVRSTNRCPSGHVTIRETTTYITELQFPEGAGSDTPVRCVSVDVAEPHPRVRAIDACTAVLTLLWRCACRVCAALWPRWMAVCARS